MAMHSGDRTETLTETTTVTCEDHHPALVLRHKVTNIADEMVKSLTTSAHATQRIVMQESEQEVEQTIDSMCLTFTSTFSSMLKGVATEVKSKAPEKPLREKYSTEEEYRVAMQAYEVEWHGYITLVATFDYVMHKVGDLIQAYLDKYRKFIEEMFEASKSETPFEKLEQKVVEFNNMIKEELLKEITKILEPLAKCSFQT